MLYQLSYFRNKTAKKTQNEPLFIFATANVEMFLDLYKRNRQKNVLEIQFVITKTPSRFRFFFTE